MHRRDIPKILISGSSYSTDNGQGVFTVNLCERLAERDVQVAALVVSPDGNANVIQQNGVTLYHLESIPVDFIRKGERYSVFPIQSIRMAFDEFQPDLVHLHDHYPLSMLVYAEAKRRGIRTIGTNHFLPENLAPFIPFYQAAPQICAWVLWRWMMVLYNQFNLVTTQSKAAAIILKQNGLNPPVVTVSCGVDIAQIFPNPEINRMSVRSRYNIDPKQKVLLYVGRLDREKRLDSVIEAFHQLQRTDIQLVIAGKGKESERLKHMAAKLCLPGQVIFPGYIPQADLNQLLNSVDCFIMPSDAELLSIATLEAMASGLPILAANAYALTELVTDGVNGNLFIPQNTADIASKITQFFDFPEQWASMKAASVERAKKHDIELVMNQFIHFYQVVKSTGINKKIILYPSKHKVSN